VGPKVTLVGCVQIASTTKLIGFPMPLFTVANQTSGGPPAVDESQSEFVMFTAGSVESVNAPPPVTTKPAGHVAPIVADAPAATGVVLLA
jgi:hypothetical protein